MRRLHSLRKPKYDNEQNNSEAICTAVLDSVHFFYVHEVRSVNFSDEWVQSQLTIHADLYPKSLRQSYSEGNANTYTERTISCLDENVQEYLFACAAKKRRSEDLEVYFISDEYDLSYLPDNAGRFVFKYDKKDTKINLVALAESPVEVSSFTHTTCAVDKPYCQPSFENAIQENRCNHLTRLENHRLCAVALNAEYYKGRVIFLSREEDVREERKTVDLVFKYAYSRENFGKGEVTNVSLAFECVAQVIGSEKSQSAVFYITSSDDDEYGESRFFICHEIQNRKCMIQSCFHSNEFGIVYPEVDRV